MAALSAAALPSDDDGAGTDVFADPDALRIALAGVGYLADERTAGVVSLAARLGKPVLVEGPAGTGKTQLAKSVAQLSGRRLVRLQCYEGIDESKALYEWDYRKQLLWIQAARDVVGFDADAVTADGAGIFAERFLLARPLLESIRSADPTVLLVDEVDRVDAETEALFLEVLGEHQVTVPELGRMEARHVPIVFLTSNGTRDLSEALKRRCLFLYLGYPSAELERDIVRHHVPELPAALAAELVALVERLRGLALRKPPSVSESIDLAQSLEVIRERMIADRGAADVARTLRRPLRDDVDLTMATAAQLTEIEESMPALQRKLATTLLRRRRRAHGVLDVRATLRCAMATGGVPVTLVERAPRPTKPQLFVLADMSGSVANFASFSISLMSAMAPLFSGLRTFAFVRDAVEVTDIVSQARTSRAAAHAVRATITRTAMGSSTDYGRSLTMFRDAVYESLGHRSTVLVLGDARGNYAPARATALVDVARRAGSVYWLNPEPVSLWGSGDSLAPDYAPHCTDMVSCRTVADLRRFVERLD